MGEPAFIRTVDGNPTNFVFRVITWNPKSIWGDKIPLGIFKTFPSSSTDYSPTIAPGQNYPTPDATNITVVPLDPKVRLYDVQKSAIRNVEREIEFDPYVQNTWYTLPTKTGIYGEQKYFVRSDDHTGRNLAIMVDGHHRYRADHQSDTSYYGFQSDVTCTLLTYGYAPGEKGSAVNRELFKKEHYLTEEGVDRFQEQLRSSKEGLGEHTTKEHPMSVAAHMGQFNLQLPYVYDAADAQKLPSKHWCVSGLPLQAIQWNGEDYTKQMMNFSSSVSSVVIVFDPLTPQDEGRVFAFGTDWMNASQFDLSEISNAIAVAPRAPHDVSNHLMPLLLNQAEFRKSIDSAHKKSGPALPLGAIREIRVNLDVALEARATVGQQLVSRKPYASSTLSFVPTTTN